MVAEHLVSDLLEQSNLQELNGSEKQFEVETERLNSRLEHARANNAVLALTLHESKAQCDRYVHQGDTNDNTRKTIILFPTLQIELISRQVRVECDGVATRAFVQ